MPLIQKSRKSKKTIKFIEIREKISEESIVDLFIVMYDIHLFEWKEKEKNKKNSYYSPDNLPDTIKTIIKYLTEKHLCKDSLITDWRTVEEMPESYEYQDIIFSIVNLIIRNTPFSHNFLPNGIKYHISEYKNADFRKRYLKSIYFKTHDNIVNLNETINYKQKKISEIFSSRNKDVQLNFYNLYKSNEFIYLFSGVNVSILDNDDLLKFMNEKRNQNFSIRSWTIDLRVAMQFTSSEISGERKDENIEENPFRVIFITKSNKICYVSSKESWEAEVLYPYSQYKYEGHFWRRIQFYNPPYNSEKPKELFLFVIITITEIPNFRLTNNLQLERLTDDLFERYLTDEVLKQSSNLNNDFILEKDDDDNLLLPRYAKGKKIRKRRPKRRSHTKRRRSTKKRRPTKRRRAGKSSHVR